MITNRNNFTKLIYEIADTNELIDDPTKSLKNVAKSLVCIEKA